MQHHRHALDTHVETHERRDGVEIQPDQHTGDAPERRSYAECYENNRVDIDAENARDT